MPVLSDELRERIRAEFPKYPDKRAVTLPALHIVHCSHGEVTPAAMAATKPRELRSARGEQLLRPRVNYVLQRPTASALHAPGGTGFWPVESPSALSRLTPLAMGFSYRDLLALLAPS